MLAPNEYMNWETGEMTTPDKDKRLTPAQRSKIKQLMSNMRIIESIVVSDGGCLGLPNGWASVAFLGSGVMGIDPDGRGYM